MVLDVEYGKGWVVQWGDGGEVDVYVVVYCVYDGDVVVCGIFVVDECVLEVGLYVYEVDWWVLCYCVIEELVCWLFWLVY